MDRRPRPASPPPARRASRSTCASVTPAVGRNASRCPRRLDRSEGPASPLAVPCRARLARSGASAAVCGTKPGGLQPVRRTRCSRSTRVSKPSASIADWASWRAVRSRVPRRWCTCRCADLHGDGALSAAPPGSGAHSTVKALTPERSPAARGGVGSAESQVSGTQRADEPCSRAIIFAAMRRAARSDVASVGCRPSPRCSKSCHMSITTAPGSAIKAVKV